MINCNEHDYIEIVCMYRYPIKVTMKTGEVIAGTALDTKRNDAREECIKVSVAGAEFMLVLDSISTLEVCIENPHFQRVSFT
jgi:Rho-binding antiterminator